MAEKEREKKEQGETRRRREEQESGPKGKKHSIAKRVFKHKDQGDRDIETDLPTSESLVVNTFSLKPMMR